MAPSYLRESISWVVVSLRWFRSWERLWYWSVSVCSRASRLEDTLCRRFKVSKWVRVFSWKRWN